MSWSVAGYDVEERLGAGATGEVWRARSRASGGWVALKRVAVGPETSAAARSEAALLATLQHPHLIRLHELIVLADELVLVLDLAPGGSLAQLLTRRGRLSPGEVVGVLAPIASALTYAHNEGIVHGDVAPANVLFTEDAQPLLSDLGVARIVGDQGPVYATAAYVDPAVAAGGPPGPATDVFMLAAVAVHALTGQPVWAGADAAAMLAQAATGRLDGVSARLAAVPPALADVVERALAPDPNRRATAAEFALDLRHVLAPVPIELGAGRASSAPRHARVVSPAPDRDRPSFVRPAALGFEASADQAGPRTGSITQGIRAAVRPERDRPLDRVVARLGQARRSGWSGRAVGVVAAVLIALTGIGAWWHGHGSHPVASAAAVGVAGPTAVTPTAVTPTSTPPAAVFDSAAALAALQVLDGRREQAFAQNAPQLLKQVYASPALLAQDTALLARMVQPGCGLVGLHTTYTGVRVLVAVGERRVVEASASLSPSRLVCGKTQSGTAQGQAATALRIELTVSGDGYRMISQQTQ